jgi:hypothetical protein
LYSLKGRFSTARRKVSDDWFNALPRDKSALFDTVTHRWECSYAMMSVALDDALSMRARGLLVSARQQLPMAADLLERLAVSLISFCDVVSMRGRRVVDIPPVEPLNAEFFRGQTGQLAASRNRLLHHVLFGDRYRFLQKLRILSDTIEQLRREFSDAAGEVARGMSIRPGTCWESFDALHYDFNTCLREAEVLLKCFLRALPAEQLLAFAAELNAPPELKRARMRPRAFSASA